MRIIPSTIVCALTILTVGACTGRKTPVADTAGAATVAPPLDSTVQHVILPDTLVRGDGKKCVVDPISRADTTHILGTIFTACDWR
jgi:hypothetical protein